MNASLPPLLQKFFAEELLGSGGAGGHTVAAYRDALRLLLRFACARLDRAPSALGVEDFDAELVAAFLQHLETDRGNAPRTRNARRAAIATFFRYVALHEPAHLHRCQRVLAIPVKRHDRSVVEFLTESEAAAVVAAPDVATRVGRRDRALLLVAVRTGLRNGELRGLRREDAVLGSGAHVRCLGKGRKARCTPLERDAAAVLSAWMKETPDEPRGPLFPSASGSALSADALQRLVGRHVAKAAAACPRLAGRRITPHTLRHTAAMALLRRGVDVAVIALWLGHESVETTYAYLHADMRLKEKALAHDTVDDAPPERFVPEDSLLAFLAAL